MLEKKKGVRRIHMLRIIALLEADFNTALKILFAKRLMDNAENVGLSEEQWGSRRNRMALDPAMKNLMTFEYGRYMRATIAMFAADLTACFDRVYPALSNVVCGKFGMDINVLRCKGITMEKMEHSVRTGHGVSLNTYGNRPGQPKKAGEGQGKGDVAITYALQSSTLLDAHALLYDGLRLPPPTPGPGIAKRNDDYVDDVNTWSAVFEFTPDAAETAMNRLERGSQSLTNLNEVPGGSTAFHKCAVFLLSWTSGPKTLEIRRDLSDFKFILHDNKNAPSAISILQPHQTNKGLGYHMAVDANQVTEHTERLGKIQGICNGAQTTRLGYDESLQLLNQRLLMQTKYGLVLSQYTPKLAHPLSVLINETFLPLLHIHRRMPRAVVWGPKALGGLELNTNVYSVQAQCAVSFFVRAIRWQGSVATDIICTLNALQLLSGFVSPLLEVTSPEIRYVGRGWLVNLREMLHCYGITVWIEGAWRFPLQRQGDCALMERFASNPNITPVMLVYANEFRIWMRIISLAQLASVDGTNICIDRIRNNSEWRAKSDGLNWPNVREPTNKHRAAFRKCLQLEFCSNAPQSCMTVDYQLDYPLGKWYPVQRYIQYDAYQSKDHVYLRDEIGLHRCVPHGRGFYKAESGVILRSPLKSNPIEPNYTAPDTIWTHKPRQLVRPRIPRNPRVLLSDEIPPEYAGELDVISDAAVHVDQCKAAVSWRIVTPDNTRRAVSMPLEAYKGTYSYRQESVGIYHGLHDTLLRFPNASAIRYHCDNKAGINKIQKPATSPGELMSSDMDVILAIQQLVDNTSTPVQFHHVKGHVDRLRGRDPTRIERENIECDKSAEECIGLNLAPLPFAPPPGARCMVLVRGEWIGQDVDKAVQLLPAEEQLKQYLESRLLLPRAVIDTIDTDAILTARSAHGWARVARVSKMMTGWMPVGHNWRHHGADNDLCPCCGQPDETFIHLLCCPSPSLTELRQASLRRIDQIARDCGIPLPIVRLLGLVLNAIVANTSEAPTLPQSLELIWNEQQRVGLANLAIGWISNAWAKGLAHHGSTDPEGHAAQILTLVWDGLCEPIWEMRNSIMNDLPNPTRLREMQSLEERLRWYHRHRFKVLAHRHRFLAEYRVDDIHRWDRDQGSSEGDPA
jgi:hypothetical protein